MEIVQTFMSYIGLGGFTTTSAVTLFLGATIGWIVPQPAFMQPITNLICDKFGLDRLHQEGHQHSDAHEPSLVEIDSEAQPPADHDEPKQ